MKAYNKNRLFRVTLRHDPSICLPEQRLVLVTHFPGLRRALNPFLERHALGLFLFCFATGWYRIRLAGGSTFIWSLHLIPTVSFAATNGQRYP